MPQDATDDVNVDWGNGLLPSGKKPLPDPMLTQPLATTILHLMP